MVPSSPSRLKAAKKQTFGLRGAAISTTNRPVDPTVNWAPQAAREIAALLDRADGKVTAKNSERIIRWFREVDPQTIAAYRPVAQHAKREPKPDFATVFAAGTRGNDVYTSTGATSEEAGVASPGFLEVLMYGSADDESWTGEPTTAKNKPTIEPRVALANWMTDTDHGGDSFSPVSLSIGSGSITWDGESSRLPTILERKAIAPLIRNCSTTLPRN